MRPFSPNKAGVFAVLLCATLALAACDRPTPEKLVKSDAAAGAATLKVAFVYSGPVADGGWTYAHDQARKALQAEFGERIQTSYVENVAEGPAAAHVFKTLAEQGNRLIFGTSFGYMEPMLAVAKDFPEVKFEHATGHKTAGNMSVYAARTYEGAYLAGVLAGKVSQSNKLGFVASVPIPEVFRNINAFTLGAQSVNPRITTHVGWVNRWIDPERERAVALELIGQGADVLIQNTDSPAVLQAAQEKGALAFGWDSDMTHYGASAHLGSAVIDWAPYYKKVVADVLDGKWKPGAVWWGTRQNVVRIASPRPELDPEVLLLLGETTHALKSGALQPFRGPLVARDGRQVTGEGVVLDDANLQAMRFFVKGVHGALPG